MKGEAAFELQERFSVEEDAALHCQKPLPIACSQRDVRITKSLLTNPSVSEYSKTAKLGGSQCSYDLIHHVQNSIHANPVWEIAPCLSHKFIHREVVNHIDIHKTSF